MTSTGAGAHAATRPARWTTTVAAVVGIMLVAAGTWALVAPQSFFDAVATFAPYNQHFLQDIGAFQIGLGAVLLLALRAGDALGVALLGVGIGSLAHVISHVVGADLGGRPAVDIPTFAVLTVLLLAAGWVRSSPPVRSRT